MFHKWILTSKSVNDYAWMTIAIVEQWDNAVLGVGIMASEDNTSDNNSSLKTLIKFIEPHEHFFVWNNTGSLSEHLELKNILTTVYDFTGKLPSPPAAK